MVESILIPGKTEIIELPAPPAPDPSLQYGTTPSFVAATSKNHFGSTGVVNKPTGVAAGDLLLGAYGGDVKNQDTGIVSLGGFIHRAHSGTRADTTLTVQSKVAGASEPATYTWGAGIDITDGVSALAAFRNVGRVGAAVQAVSDTANLNVPELPIHAPRQLLVMFVAAHTSGGDIATPTGWTRVANEDRWWPEIGIFYKEHNSAAAHPAFTVSINLLESGTMPQAVVFALEPSFGVVPVQPAVLEPGLLGRALLGPTTDLVVVAPGSFARVHNDLHVPFVGPPSGWVLVRLNGAMSCNGNSLGEWGLFTAANALVPLSDTGIRFANNEKWQSDCWYLMQVTPGQSYDWYWAHVLAYGSSITTIAEVMEVYDAATYSLAFGRRTAAGDFTGDSGIDLSFVAPPSGCVDLWASGWFGDGQGGHVEFKLPSGGARIRNSAFVYQSFSGGRFRGGGRCRVGGLTPGQSYMVEPYASGVNCKPGNFGTSMLTTFVKAVPAAA
jgi:hypothetical protein